jgi:hypothetical protein
MEGLELVVRKDALSAFHSNLILYALALSQPREYIAKPTLAEAPISPILVVPSWYPAVARFLSSM